MTETSPSAPPGQPLRLSVVGTGYLGATHAAGMADLGHDVIGIDVEQEKVDRLSKGEVPFFEPGLSELLRRGLDSGRLCFNSYFEEGDVH